MTEERFEQMLREHARDYNAPPETPREAMWREIELRRQGRQGRQGRQNGIPVRWVTWAVAAAAVLAVGIGIGRMTVPDPQGVPAQIAAGPDADDDVSPVAFQLAAAEHLARVEAFLTLFRGDAEAGRTPDVGPTRTLLLTTRLMQQSPAADDPALGALLNDVELVLAQISLYRAGQDDQELEFITDGIEQRDVLLKLRSAAAERERQPILQGA